MKFYNHHHNNDHIYSNKASFHFKALIALVDTIVSSRPWNIWYVLYPTFLGISYLIFNAIYILVFNGTNSKGEEYVYDILDWKNNPGKCGILFGGTIVGIPIVFGVFPTRPDEKAGRRPAFEEGKLVL